MNSYIVEFDEKFRDGEQVVFSEQISSTPKPFRVHFPKDASKKSLETLSEHITAFETFVTTIDSATPLDSIEAWLDMDAFVKHYWDEVYDENDKKNIQEKKVFVAIKTATTLDGKIAAKDNSSKWITSDKAREEVQKLKEELMQDNMAIINNDSKKFTKECISTKTG